MPYAMHSTTSWPSSTLLGQIWARPWHQQQDHLSYLQGLALSSLSMAVLHDLGVGSGPGTP